MRKRHFLVLFPEELIDMLAIVYLLAPNSVLCTYLQFHLPLIVSIGTSKQENIYSYLGPGGLCKVLR